MQEGSKAGKLRKRQDDIAILTNDNISGFNSLLLDGKFTPIISAITMIHLTLLYLKSMLDT